MREKDNQWQQGEVTVKLAKAYGYCWGVERAVRMAYEARNANPDQKVYITNEIIHNPEVNQVGISRAHTGSGLQLGAVKAEQSDAVHCEAGRAATPRWHDGRTSCPLKGDTSSSSCPCVGHCKRSVNGSVVSVCRAAAATLGLEGLAMQTAIAKISAYDSARRNIHP